VKPKYVSVPIKEVVSYTLERSYGYKIPKGIKLKKISVSSQSDFLNLTFDIPEEVTITLLSGNHLPIYTYSCENNTLDKTLKSLIKDKCNLSNIDFTRIKTSNDQSEEAVVIRFSSLENLDLSNLNLSNSNFSGLKLTNIDFSNSCLFGTNFKNCNMKKVDFGKGGVIG